ncbi:hypothetical protein KFU94_39765 [Chloroflexi bacterium TSY]|nr:hypothetical protein [Chloroflexi bacterium TSY]
MVTINFMSDLTWENGPIQIPGTHIAQQRPPTPEEEPEWMRLSTLGCARGARRLPRQPRAWGNPNLSREIRAMPNVEYVAPWFPAERLRPTAFRDLGNLVTSCPKVSEKCELRKVFGHLVQASCTRSSIRRKSCRKDFMFDRLAEMSNRTKLALLSPSFAILAVIGISIYRYRQTVTDSMIAKSQEVAESQERLKKPRSRLQPRLLLRLQSHLRQHPYWHLNPSCNGNANC